MQHRLADANITTAWLAVDEVADLDVMRRGIDQAEAVLQLQTGLADNRSEVVRS